MQSETARITLPERQVPIQDVADVVVCGGGSAGAVAAISAARNGARTVLLERSICLGGNATCGMMNRFGPFHDQREFIIGGIPWEIVGRLTEMNACIEPVPCSKADERYWVPFDPESLKFVLDRLVQDAHVKVLFNTWVSDVADAERPYAHAVIFESKAGRRAILAKVVVDATGDGDVAVSAGASFNQGRERDGLTQPITLLYKVNGLDRAKAMKYLKAHEAELLDKAKKNGDRRPQYVGAGSDNALHEDQTYYNIDHVFRKQGTEPVELTDSIFAARRIVWESLEFAKKYVPGYERAYLSATASQIGVRETRRIVGDYILTGDDVLGARKFDDAVSKNACYVDVHANIPKEDRGNYSGRELSAGQSYDIPLRSLVPKGLERFLVAGRCISASHEALGSARTIPSCMAMGQAAGTVGAIAAKADSDVRDVPIRKLQDVLRSQGAKI